MPKLFPYINEFNAALALSLDANGTYMNMLGSSIRNPCNLHMGLPLESHRVSIANAILLQNFLLPGVIPVVEPKEILGHSCANLFNLSIDSFKCQTGTPWVG